MEKNEGSCFIGMNGVKKGNGENVENLVHYIATTL